MQVVNSDYLGTRGRRFWKAKEHFFLIAWDRDELHFFQRLDTALYHARFFDVRAKAVDPVFDFFNFLLLIRIGLAQLLKACIAFFHVVAIVALEAVEITQFKLHRTIGDFVEEGAVVGNNN